MKKKILIAISILVIGVTACGQKNITEVESGKISSETGTETKKESNEETTSLKIEKHEEDWQYLLGNMIGEVDWNANMPKVGEWAFLNYRYYPNKREGNTPDPYFFMDQTVFEKATFDIYGVEISENVEEVPEIMLNAEKKWTSMGSSSSTLGAKYNQSTRAVIKTKEKRVIDGYDFMRVTGEFEVYYDETKEVDKTFKFIAYFYVSVDPSFEEDERFNTSSMLNNMIYWCEGFSEERGDYASIEETADKIMSTLKLTDEQREYLKKKKG